jgi:predicted secreted acid phosphatase
VTINWIVNKIEAPEQCRHLCQETRFWKTQTDDPNKLLMKKRQITKYLAMIAADLKETVLEVSSFSDWTIQHCLQK